MQEPEFLGLAMSLWVGQRDLFGSLDPGSWVSRCVIGVFLRIS